MTVPHPPQSPARAAGILFTKTEHEALDMQHLTWIEQQTGAPINVCGILLVVTLHDPASTHPQ
ncbi:hypothetical protein AYY17_14445 [Morganella psychrotolerans]|uniref:Uncharacterized protein n=1 Tax=Morganella psychrotolerans TaxID=368603 RepID=A0A1B8HMQ8_9GAMM|nr:hypothetical protein AYY17_14445 [Morganella psychrotolerans]